ncbi:PilZ domain-containing protein [bacterium]|nr:PilZ domain-containing protein [bacterium]
MNKIFLPSKGVDIVFNINALTPYSRASIIFDIDLSNKNIIVAQPLTKLTKDTQFKELHLTTIFNDKNRKLRVGVKCIKVKLIKKYKLANKKYVSAVVLKYELPIIESNIRSAFRLPLSVKYVIKGKIFYKGLEYTSQYDFSIVDISLTGMGLKIPRKRRNNINPLIKIKITEKILIGILLINTTKEKPIATFPISAEVVRIRPDYTETQSWIGIKILKLKNNNETILNKFIHDAQVDELKRLSWLDL